MGFYQSSDAQLKRDIRPVDNALDRLLKFRGVSFNWKKDGRPDDGVIAQEVEKVFPELVSKDQGGIRSVEYNGLIGSIVESIRDLKQQTDFLKKENNELRAIVEKQGKEIEGLKGGEGIRAVMHGKGFWRGYGGKLVV